MNENPNYGEHYADISYPPPTLIRRRRRGGWARWTVLFVTIAIVLGTCTASRFLNGSKGEPAADAKAPQVSGDDLPVVSASAVHIDVAPDAPVNATAAASAPIVDAPPEAPAPTVAQLAAQSRAAAQPPAPVAPAAQAQPAVAPVRMVQAPAPKAAAPKPVAIVQAPPAVAPKPAPPVPTPHPAAVAPRSASTGAQANRFYYVPRLGDGPGAIFSGARGRWDYALACSTATRRIEFIAVGTGDPGGFQGQMLAAGGVRADLDATYSKDGGGTISAKLPATSPLLAALKQGATLQVKLVANHDASLPINADAARLVRMCRGK